MMKINEALFDAAATFFFISVPDPDPHWIQEVYKKK
jgi:hypothetical protein